MKFDDLERAQQWYDINLGDTSFSLTGKDIDSVLASDTTLVMLKNGEVINKAFIRFVKKDVQKTKDNLQKNKELSV